MKLTHMLLLAMMLIANAAFAEPAQEDITPRKVDIYSEGTRLTGYIYSARPESSAERLPTIVLAHGWGGTQRSLRRDAVGFARAGYLVLTFDYRGWGESDSRVILTGPGSDSAQVNFKADVRAVREVVDPLDMAADWLNALHFVVGEAQCDVSRLGLWGSSLSGGLVIHAAAHDARVKAVHSQVTGTLSGRNWGQSAASLTEATRRARGDLNYPEPRASYGNLRGAPIINRFRDYEPAKDIGNNSGVALQFVLAENEEYGGNPIAISTFEQHKGPKNLVIIEGIGHYDVYRGAWERAHTLALKWFDKHLKSDP